VAADVQTNRLRIAERLGAVATIHVGDGPPLAAQVAALGIVPTLVFEVTGTQGGYEAAVAAIDPGGRIVTVGIANGALTVDALRVTVEELELRGTNALIGAEDVHQAARLLSLEQHRWAGVAPVAIPLERLVEDGLQPLVEGRAQRIKTLVDPWIATVRETAMTPGPDSPRRSAVHLRT
jgi:(R,R)-butanediol dehydrogenase / meso-butanediol dehydrogenase / diacetyl reductase